MSSYKHRLSGWGSLAVILLGISPLLAQNEATTGLIRITDKSTTNFTAPTATVSQTRTVSQCETCVNQGHSPSGHCQQCDYGNSNCPNCYSGGHWMMGPHLAGLCYGCTRSPGTGYIPPGRIPVKREAVGYAQWYPSYWSGMGYGNPVPYNPAVAVPTDTTQLGYYYNQVPTWQPKSNMIPGIPNPDSWHVRRCANQTCFGNSPSNCPQCQVQAGSTSNHTDNLKPVPEHINQPSHTTEKGDNSPSTMKKAVVNEPAEPMAFFPEFAPMPEPATKLISFPELDVATDIDAEE